MDSAIDDSYFDRLHHKYKKLVKKCSKNERLKRYSSRYDKYVIASEGGEAISFVITKLIVAFCFTILVIISFAIWGRVIGFFGFLISFIIGYYVYDIYLII